MPIIAWKPGDRKCGDSRTPEQVLPPPSPSAASVVAQVYPPLWTRRSPRKERDLDDQAECTAAAGLNSQNPNQSPERGGEHGVLPFILLMRVAQGRMTERLALELHKRALLLVRAVGWIVGGFDFRETPHAGSVDLGKGVLERLALDIFLDRPVLDLPLQADELPFQKRLGEVGEIAPGVDAVPFGAGFVLALVVFPALAGGKVEDGVVLLVLRGLDFCILSETADEDDFVEHGL